MDSLHTKLFINNEYVTSKNNTKPLIFQGPRESSPFSVDFANAGKEDVDAAVQFAKQAFKGPWKKTFTAHQRRYILCRFAELLEENIDDLVEISRYTMGDAVAKVAANEVRSAADIWRFYSKCAEQKTGDSFSTEDGLLKVTWNEPLGVTAGITSWNAPLVALSTKAAPALITGNTFILKPSEKSPFAALALGELIKEAGFPPGVFQILTGGADTGALIVGHPKVQVVSFTGSAATGKKVQLAAKSDGKRVTLDVDGKTPLVIFEDADIANAVQWAVRALVAKPETCYSAARIYVQKPIYKTFVEAYKIAVEAGVHSRRSSGSSTINLVEDSNIRNEPERLENEITPPASPKIFTNDRPDADFFWHEILGPVAVVSSFESESEVVFRINVSSYGLMAGVFTQDVERALHISAALEVEMVGINCVSKPSCSGEAGETALRTYTEPKTAFVSIST